MQYSVDAHRIMSMSVGKIYTSRVQRGGIKLHKNLLLSLVLRSARDVCLTNYCLSASHPGEPDLDPGETESDQGHIPYGSGELEGCDSRFDLTRGESSWTVPEQGTDSTADAGQEVPGSDCGCRSTRRGSASSTDAPVSSEDPRLRDPCSPDSGAAEAARNAGAGGESREAGDCGDDCGSRPEPHRAAACLKATRKRDADCDDDAPRTDSPRKRNRPTLPSDSIVGDVEEEEEEMDTGNVSSLISVFGAGFSGLLRKESAEAEPEPETCDSGSGAVCAEPSLGTLNPWGTAIEAF